MPGWVESQRRSELPGDWRGRRAKVRRRAKGRCEWIEPETGQRCWRPGAECDHVAGKNNHALSNLQWLCVEHHKLKTQREAQAGKQNRSRYRPIEPSPGLLDPQQP